jgi:hypothetical protein
MDDTKEGSSRLKIFTHFIRGRISLSPMVTIISILNELKHFESMVKLARRKQDENLKL